MNNAVLVMSETDSITKAVTFYSSIREIRELHMEINIDAFARFSYHITSLARTC